MALDLLSIPAMSAKAERIFSQAGNIVRPNRASLKSNTLAAVICLKQWEEEGMIKWDEPPLPPPPFPDLVPQTPDARSEVMADDWQDDMDS